MRVTTYKTWYGYKATARIRVGPGSLYTVDRNGDYQVKVRDRKKGRAIRRCKKKAESIMQSADEYRARKEARKQGKDGRTEHHDV